MASSNAKLPERLLMAGFGGGDMSVLDEVVSENLVEHQLGLPRGREGLKSVVRALRQAFPDLKYSVLQLAEDGDKVWGHFRARGTHLGPFMGSAPTGKSFEIDVIDIARFDDGQLVEHWGVPDRLGLLLQLGIFPPSRFPADVPR